MSAHEWALVPDAVWDGSVHSSGLAVLVAGGRVSGVVPIEEIPAGIERQDVAGTAIPGLIDCHVHLADWMLPGFLAAGVTTVRDTGNQLDWIVERRTRTENDPAAGPRILCVGPLLDGAEAWWPVVGRPHPDASSIRRSVAELAAAGVDAIKLYVNVSPEQVEAAVQEATAAGLPVLAHLGTTTLAEAVERGVTELEHMSGCVHHVGGSAVTGDGRSLAETILAAGVTLCPTLVVWDRLATVNEMVYRHDGRHRWVHPGIRQAWSRFPHRFGSADERASRQQSVVEMKRMLLELYDAGCDVIAGSDTPWPNIVPGFGLHDELALMVDAGLRPVDALAAATVSAARALGLEGEVGTLSPGARADIVVIGGDPTDDILALADIRLVVRDGVPISSWDLEARTFETWRDDPVSRLILGQAGL
jgi:imidazolonepropionase-like amidohydrolase